MARIAKSLDVLRTQVQTLYPTAPKKDFGWIGNRAHQATKSDHNPDHNGVVRALDIPHIPKIGLDTYAMAERLRLGKDIRISYVISNGRLFSSSVAPWTWRAYRGRNDHSAHVHISVRDNPVMYDNIDPWMFGPLEHYPPTESYRQERITATVFGGPGDEQDTAYGGALNPYVMGCSLPYHFAKPRPTVRVFHKGREADLHVIDVGPWNISDPYWTQKGRRPQAENGRDLRGRRTNRAGIDLTPTAAHALGCTGLDLVDWEFVR